MGIKSRGNYRIGWCSETLCLNRGVLCDKCIRKDKLKRSTKKDRKVKLK